jgi:hypothetical protein
MYIFSPNDDCYCHVQHLTLYQIHSVPRTSGNPYMRSRFNLMRGYFDRCIATVAYPGIIFGGGSTNSAENRGQREGGSGGSSPLVRGFTQFAIERNPYYD